MLHQVHFASILNVAEVVKIEVHLRKQSGDLFEIVLAEPASENVGVDLALGVFEQRCENDDQLILQVLVTGERHLNRLGAALVFAQTNHV